MCGISQGFAVCCRWFVLGLILTGIVLSCMAVASCHFLKYVDGDGNNGAVGLYRYYDTNVGGCIDHPDALEYSESENAARMGGVVAPLAASFSLFIIIIEFACCRFICSRLLIGLGLIAAQIAQGLTFLIFGSAQFCNGDIVNEVLHQKPCSVSDGSIFSVVALLLYFFSGVIVFCTPKPEPMRKKNVNVESSRSSTAPCIEEGPTPAETESATFT